MRLRRRGRSSRLLGSSVKQPKSLISTMMLGAGADVCIPLYKHHILPRRIPTWFQSIQYREDTPVA